MTNPIRSMARPAGWRRGPAGQVGATLVEFVIVGPIALLLVLGIVQLGLMFVAKQIVNEATFVAARAGAVQNAQVRPMRETLVKALIPFYQDTLDTDSFTRLLNAFGRAQGELLPPLPPPPHSPLSNLDIDILNPTPDVFNDFGVPDANNQLVIPNDSLGYRTYTDNHGPTTGLSIQDANVLKIRVTYAYQLKVPLMQSVFRSVMCGFDSGVNAFGRGGAPGADAQNCAQFYNRGRVPIVAYATVQMQSPARQ